MNPNEAIIQRRTHRSAKRSFVLFSIAGRVWAAVTWTVRSFIAWVVGVSASSIIIALLLFIVINFYIFTSLVNLNSFFYSFLLLSLLVDGLFVLLHLPRRKAANRKLSFDASKLTVVIACYNGEDVIAETIRQAMVHVPAKQIIVVSDASTDNTYDIAKNLGVHVVQNRKNMHKAFSVSIGMKFVSTPYVLILDDDTHIGKTFIPTSLLDEGYNAVAFNVMPMKDKSLLNALQQFEYRQAMQIGKNVRAGAGAIGNISGAIGLYRTKDLIHQVRLHSGQFAGEDEQRTLLVHMNSYGKGITYTNSTVLTSPPNSYLNLYRQRAYSWSVALPELFVLYWKMLLTPRFHYLLKAEKAYYLYLYLTDPLRILFFWALFFRTSHIFLIYGFYLLLNILVWFKTGAKDSFRAVLFYPFYSLGLTVCRFIGHFYWLKVKASYLAKRLYRYAENRRLLLEYSTVFAVLVVTWATSTLHFANDMSLLNKIHANRLDETSNNFKYDSTPSTNALAVAVPIASVATTQQGAYQIAVNKGDTKRVVAMKAVNKYLADTNSTSLQQDHWKAYTWLADKITEPDPGKPGGYVTVNIQLVQQALAQEGGA